MRKSDSVQGWRKKWFYFTSSQEGLPEFIAHKPLKKTVAWTHPLMTEDKATLKPFIGRIAELLKTLGQEEGGIHLIATFMKRQIQPLRLRSHPMWADEGPSDPNRMFEGDLPDDEVVQKVKSITSLRVADPCNVKCPITPYGADNRLPKVTFCIRTEFPFSHSTACLNSATY